MNFNSTFLIYLFVLFIIGVYSNPISISEKQQDQLTVHIIAHTHDDVGWLKTVDEYYMGANQSIQDAGVQYILDNTINSLLADPNKKFIYVEIAFFERWWREQEEFRKQQVRDLVASGQLEFINGGWCMNDEATTYYPAIIEQMTRGHQFLYDEFGVRPRIGWHIDPFGHAATQASLFAQMGFDAFFFGRIDFGEHQIRQNDEELEFVWRGSQSLGTQTEIWSHVLYTDYCYLPGFAFEYGDPPIQDDPSIFDMNVKERSDLFASEVRTRAASYRTPNILAPFGCDFRYENAIMNFKNIDKLIKYINNHQEEYGMTLMYSTPRIYMEYVYNTSTTWEVRTGDFFPYADCPHCYWSGFYTSRPALKGYVRLMDNFLHAVDKLYTTSSVANIVNSTDYYDRIDVLTQAFSVAQHHDAVSGTEQQHVAYDYAKRLSIGEVTAQGVMSDVLGLLVNQNGNTQPSFSFCPLLNMSICPATSELANGNAVPVVVYNPIAWERNHFVTLVVPISNVDVYNGSGGLVQAQIFENADYSDQYTIVFPVTIPALGFSTYTLQQGSGEMNVKTQRVEITEPQDTVIQNEMYVLTFSASTNRLSSILNKATGQTLQVEQDYMWWNASAGNTPDGQASGAYIFRPNGTSPFPVLAGSNPTISVMEGPLVTEVYQVWNNWVSQTIQLFQGEPLFHTIANIGPIDISDGLGKEVITRFTTSLNSAGVWYTDSEGDEMQQRVYDYRPWPQNVTEPVASNYYPMNTAAFIEDSTVGQRFTVITDRSRGCSSLTSGQFENMLHRRLLYDDGRGVGEPLNETEAIRTQEFVFFDAIQNSSSLMRLAALLLQHQPTLAFSTATSAQSWNSQYSTSFAPLYQPLPKNVHMTSLKTLDDGYTILRLHHIFAVGEDIELSLPAKVDLGALFSNLAIVEITEMTMTANRPLSELHRLQWKTSSDEEKNYSNNLRQDNVIILNPMDTRTFLVRFQPL